MFIYWIILFIFSICALLESKTTGVFQTFHVYHRKQVSLALLLPFGIIMIAINLSSYQHDFSPIFSGIICCIMGINTYFRIYHKCPKTPALKKSCILAIFISSNGIALKSLIFFLKDVWKLETPQKIKVQHNHYIYLLNNNYYDENGILVTNQINTRKDKRLKKNKKG